MTVFFSSLIVIKLQTEISTYLATVDKLYGHLSKKEHHHISNLI